MRGSTSDKVSATSPVPGGMSIKRKSGWSHQASVMSCSIALCNIGPRQITGCSSGTKYPIETQRTP
jgi:hypothetical protein